MRLALLAIGLLVTAAFAQEATDVPLLAIQLRFSGSGASIGEVRRVTGPLPRFFGFAQGHPLYFEVRGAKKELLYAEAILDPRARYVRAITSDGRAAPTAQLPGLAEGSLVVYAPADSASTVRICRREAGARSPATVLVERGL